MIRKRGEDESPWAEVAYAIDKRQFAETTTPGTPDTEFTIEHGLGTIPLGFIVIKQDQAAVTYASDTGWDNNFMYLKTSVASVAMRVLIF